MHAPEAALIEIRSPHALHPLLCRPGSSDGDVFEDVFNQREYSTFDEEPHVDLVVDCGANVGYSSAYFLTRFPRCRLVAVEPDPSNFAVLERNLAPYGARARALHAAVWPREAALVLSEDAYRDGREWSRQVRERAAGERASVRGVDIPAILREAGETRISILKIDIEGAEAELFASNTESWLDSVDAIVIELHDDSAFGSATSVFVEACASRFAFSFVRGLAFCRRRSGGRERAPRPAIRRLHPASTPAGCGFNVQPNGSSAIAVDCDALGPRPCIVFGGSPLGNAIRSGSLLTALLPPHLYAEPGVKPVLVMDELGVSNVLEFRVTPRPEAPVDTAL